MDLGKSFAVHGDRTTLLQRSKTIQPLFPPTKTMLPSRRLRPRRRGSAVVELAICLPIVMALVWGTIELSNSIFLKQTITSAAHEGALVGTSHGALDFEIKARVIRVLDQRLSVPFTVAIETSTGSTYDALPSGYLFTVIVTANPQSFNDLFDVDTVDARVSAIKP